MENRREQTETDGEGRRMFEKKFYVTMRARANPGPRGPGQAEVLRPLALPVDTGSLTMFQLRGKEYLCKWDDGKRQLY